MQNRLPKIVAMVPLFNDEDIIVEVLSHLISEGIQPVVLDNGSTDGSYEICQELYNEDKIDLRQFQTKEFYLMEILRQLYDMALTKSPDWIILCASDEFLESGQQGLTLQRAISEVDSAGFNLIQFSVFNFFMTDDDNESETSVRKRMQYYSYDHDNNYRAWKFQPGIYPELRGGHFPVFPFDLKYKIWGKKFVLRHYPFRTKEQSIKKINERMERNKETTETKAGWHKHYQNIKEKGVFAPLNHKMLNKYHEDNNWNFEHRFTLSVSHPKKEEIFLDDGSLKNPPPSYLELVVRNQLKSKTIEKLKNKISKIEKTAK